MSKKSAMTKLPVELLGGWDRPDLVAPLHECKYFDRDRVLHVLWSRLSYLAPDWLVHIPKNSKKVVDVSAGNGASLEIMRHFGYDITGMDLYKKLYAKYELFIKSQNIPLIRHDCSTFPYPLKTKEYDLLINFGAIGQYFDDDLERNWIRVLNEFARVAKSTILFIPNCGWKLDKCRKTVMNWTHPGFKLTKATDHRFRWDHI